MDHFIYQNLLNQLISNKMLILKFLFDKKLSLSAKKPA